MSAPPELTISLGTTDLPFHRAAAAVTRRVPEAHGHRVSSVGASPEQLFRLRARGSLYVLVSAWLPHGHDAYLSPYRHRAKVLTPLYRPRCVWAVPSYVPAYKVRRVSDLARPSVRRLMARSITGTDPGTGLSRLSVRVLSEYGLDRLGYSFSSCAEAEFLSRVERGLATREWFVVRLWRPRYLTRAYGLRLLSEPRELLGTADSASPVISEEALDQIHPDAVACLDSLYLDDDCVEEIDVLIHQQGRSPPQAADQFLSGRPGLLP
ncbi:glycine betaine ABC transporter substrate-binding protein [Streptomyces sp. SAI-229]|jgi:glycine betaine/proline transport system substrate-binding protein|uniref:glycine betaine ABC transporter substrate-binding protein n=1 Tax=Streptomyces sp. SAI-229 TaxID=3377731 RepID=UPI003C7A1D25